MDSAALLAHVLKNKGSARAVSFRYGSKHGERELEAAGRVADHYKVFHRVLDVAGAFTHIRSALLYGGPKIPEGHYAAPSMAQTIVPLRNAIFLCIAAATCEPDPSADIYIAAHGGDHFIYPDCRPEFVDAISSALYHGTSGTVFVHAPFRSMTKRGIVEWGQGVGVPWALTYSCYNGGEKHCGKCGTCTERKEAFGLAGVADPTEYEA
jgi:7-cyano-7-deazaguanine synthase